MDDGHKKCLTCGRLLLYMSAILPGFDDDSRPSEGLSKAPIRP
jgi:hypothetical protein